MLITDAVKLFSEVGFKNESLLKATAIAIAESNLSPLAVGDVSLQNEKWGPSIGLFQIRSLKNPGAYSYPDNLRDASKLYDARFNAQAAFAISKNGTDFNPWSTYTQNNYKAYINKVTTAIQDAGQWMQDNKAATGITGIVAIILIALFLSNK